MTFFERFVLWLSLFVSIVAVTIVLIDGPVANRARIESLSARVNELAVLPEPVEVPPPTMSVAQEVQLEYLWRRATRPMNSGERAAFLDTLIVARMADSAGSAAEREAFMRGYLAARDSTR